MYDEASELTGAQMSEEKVYDEMGYIRCIDAGKRGLQQFLSC